jgi:lipoprotein signal peptidase
MQAARRTPLTGAAAAAPRHPRRVLVLIAVAVLVLAADILTKVIVVATLSARPPVRLLGGLLTLRVDRNPGAAFSIGTSMTLVFSAIAVGVIIYILRTSRRIRSVPWAVTLGLLLGGATGNLVDRLLRYPGPLRGYVVDWIQLPHWPVFNVADSSIVCGGILAVLLAGRGIRIDGTGLERAAAGSSGRMPGRGMTGGDGAADGGIAGGGAVPGATAADGGSAGGRAADGGMPDGSR